MRPRALRAVHLLGAAVVVSGGCSTTGPRPPPGKASPSPGRYVTATLVPDLDGDGLPEVVVADPDMPRRGVSLLAGRDGRELLHVPVRPSRDGDSPESLTAFPDVVPGRVGPDAAPGLVVGPTAYDLHGAVVWTSPEPESLIGAGDLDGDGTTDLLQEDGSEVAASTATSVVDGRNGRVRQLGSLCHATVVGDLTGAGRADDLVVDSSPSCDNRAGDGAVPSLQARTLSGQRLWTSRLPEYAAAYARPLQVLPDGYQHPVMLPVEPRGPDADGDGVPDLLVQGRGGTNYHATDAGVLRGRDGRVLWLGSEALGEAFTATATATGPQAQVLVVLVSGVDGGTTSARTLDGRQLWTSAPGLFLSGDPDHPGTLRTDAGSVTDLATGATLVDRPGSDLLLPSREGAPFRMDVSAQGVLEVRGGGPADWRVQRTLPTGPTPAALALRAGDGGGLLLVAVPGVLLLALDPADGSIRWQAG